MSTDGVGSVTLNGKEFAQGSWFIDWKTSPNIRKFQIERLIIEE